MAETKKSPEYKAYEALIERYKKQNPVKYEEKKEVLKARLAALAGKKKGAKYENTEPKTE